MTTVKLETKSMNINEIVWDRTLTYDYDQVQELADFITKNGININPIFVASSLVWDQESEEACETYTLISDQLLFLACLRSEVEYVNVIVLSDSEEITPASFVTEHEFLNKIQKTVTTFVKTEYVSPEPPQVKVAQNFEGQDLTGTDFSGQDLTGANFKNADLMDANFEGAILIDTNFEEANLIDVSFKNAILTNANMSGALLRCAKFNDADLENATLTFALLNNAKFNNANLNKANLASAWLSNSDLTNANLENADLSYAKLEDATLENVHLGNTNLKKANLKGTCLQGKRL
jgi:uncharacterized protein YjbI with pentapeptide repeats